jgi:DNA-binding Xre family transcriptional regulator
MLLIYAIVNNARPWRQTITAIIQNNNSLVFIRFLFCSHQDILVQGKAEIYRVAKLVKQNIPCVGQAFEQDLFVAQRLAKQLGSFLRKQRGDLTYRQFSKKMGISDSTLQRMEMGEQNVTLKTLEQIVDRLKCELSDIFGGG